MSRDQQSIQDIWNAAQEILNFTVGMNYESLEADRRSPFGMSVEGLSRVVIAVADIRADSAIVAVYIFLTQPAAPQMPPRSPFKASGQS